jgi:hypothetical protein
MDVATTLPVGAVIRDMSGKVGGQIGVTSAKCVYTAAGKAEATFEWNIWGLLDNYADAGENVAIYGQANSRGKGPTWGACFECCDMGELNATQLGVEITMNMAGRDVNENRMGLDVTVNDARLWRGRGPQLGPVEATVGVRVNADTDKNFSWRDAFQAWGFRRAGIALKSVFNSAVGMLMEGKMDSLVDAQGARYKSIAKIGSASGAFVSGKVGPQIGYLKIVIDGSEYAIAVNSKS